MLSLEQRKQLVLSVGQEVVTVEELEQLLQTKQEYHAYDGFEPSGQMHLAQGIFRAINVNKMIASGARFTMLVADWHAWANNKLGGDLAKIQTTGKYMIEVWKACGMQLDKVTFVWASDLVKDSTYWALVMKVAIANSLKRIVRTSQIMGRSESDALSAAQILYPCMQTADIFYLGVDVCQLGMDQRKVNMLAREIAPSLGYPKPIVVSHPMLMGLQEPPKDATDAV
ncbi:MAG: tyrosine--tRNA ligase, partial [Candidatus Woesearchaeota archaeon]